MAKKKTQGRRPIAENLLRKGKSYEEVNEVLEREKLKPYTKGSLYLIKQAVLAEPEKPRRRRRRSSQGQLNKQLEEVAKRAQEEGVTRIEIDLSGEEIQVTIEHSVQTSFTL